VRSETIGRQTASYRQGLVLGLTMAETMMLLVFCMLIAVGVTLANERAKLNDATLRLSKVEAAAAADKATVATIKRNPRLAALVEQATRAASNRAIDDLWRKLVESNDAVADMERRGVPLASLKDEADRLGKINLDKAERGVALASAIDEVVSPAAATKLTPQQIAVLIERGISAPQEGRRNGHDWPPMINLSEAGGYYFATGSADLTPEFATALASVVVNRLLQIADEFDVDVIEVIGHTDEQPVTNRVSNLDRTLAPVTLGETPAGVLQWADNAGLGLARALAVVKVLATDPRLRAFRILPLSGAQLIGTDQRLTRWDGQGDVRERRRIEIRMRKST
jgi:flagellar motor protein MotB